MCREFWGRFWERSARALSGQWVAILCMLVSLGLTNVAAAQTVPVNPVIGNDPYKAYYTSTTIDGKSYALFQQINALSQRERDRAALSRMMREATGVDKTKAPKASKSQIKGKSKGKSKKVASARRKGITVNVNLSTQRMRVYENGQLKHTWKVSSGRKGHLTPTGRYRPTRMYREYYSKKYYNSPMPHSIFFHHGYAIHGTYATGALGRRASHGCIRLQKSNARKLYNMVSAHGRSKTSIRIYK